MIISHTNKFIYLEPTGVQSNRGYLRFIDGKLINPNDIGTGIYNTSDYMTIAKPQNVELFPTSLEDYNEKCGNSILSESIFLFLDEEFTQILHSSITLKESVTLNILTEEQISTYNIFQIIRNPINRLIDLFMDSIERKRIETPFVEHFLARIAPNPIHHAWKTQLELSTGFDVHINYILFEDLNESFANTMKLFFNIDPRKPDPTNTTNKRKILPSSLPYPLAYNGYPLEKRIEFEAYYKDDILKWKEIYELYTNKSPTLYDTRYTGIYT